MAQTSKRSSCRVGRAYWLNDQWRREMAQTSNPDERTDLAYDIEPKAIRHALFGAPAPQGVVPVALVAWLSMMHGTPVEDVSNEWVQWHTNGPAKPAEMNIPLPCNVFEI